MRLLELGELTFAMNWQTVSLAHGMTPGWVLPPNRSHESIRPLSQYLSTVERLTPNWRTTTIFGCP